MRRSIIAIVLTLAGTMTPTWDAGAVSIQVHYRWYNPITSSWSSFSNLNNLGFPDAFVGLQNGIGPFNLSASAQAFPNAIVYPDMTTSASVTSAINVVAGSQIEIEFSYLGAIGVGPVPPYYVLAESNANLVGVAASISYYVDQSNTAFGHATLVAHQAPSAGNDASIMTLLTTPDPFSVTVDYVLTTSTSRPRANAAADFTYAPEPVSATLLASGLIMLGALRRRHNG